MAPARDPYLVKSVLHSSRVLSAFRASGEALPLREIAVRSGLPKSMAFRLLYTLERCGMIEKVGANLYRSSLRPFKQKLYRIGYAAQRADYQFSREVSAGLQRAGNADVLVREHVDLVIAKLAKQLRATARVRKNFRPPRGANLRELRRFPDWDRHQ